jgi:hypothetical protein
VTQGRSCSPPPLATDDRILILVGDAIDELLDVRARAEGRALVEDAIKKLQQLADLIEPGQQTALRRMP